MINTHSDSIPSTFIGDYKIENTLFYNQFIIAYTAEDMRKSTPVLIVQYPSTANKTTEISEIENNIKLLIQHIHPNLAVIKDVYPLNNCVYIITDIPQGISLEKYLNTNIYLTETEATRVIATLLSIFIFLTKIDMMMETIEFNQVYLATDGSIMLYGMFPIKKNNTSFEHHLSLLRQVLTRIITLQDDDSLYSISFSKLVDKVNSSDRNIQPKTLEELIPLFKIPKTNMFDTHCEPMVCESTTTSEKIIRISSSILVISIVAFYLFFQEAKTIQSKEIDKKHLSTIPSNPTLPIVIPTEDENVTQIIQKKPDSPINESTDKFIDFGDYVQDRKTGLLWQKDGVASGKLNFYQAQEYAKNLSLGNLNGWRVPTIKELESIFPAVEKPFKNTPYTDQQCCKGPYEWHSYWTSEMDNSLPDYAFVYHWYQFGGANNCYASKNYDYVRCVRNP